MRPPPTRIMWRARTDVTSQLATMGMPNVRYAPERSGTVNTKLTLFFEGVLGALAYLHSNRTTTLAGEGR